MRRRKAGRRKAPPAALTQVDDVWVNFPIGWCRIDLNGDRLAAETGGDPKHI